jgi:hypothetical protein
MIRNWAGPMHWKLTRSQKTSYIIWAGIQFNDYHRALAGNNCGIG